MPEWSIGAVSKTVVPYGTQGSNPCLSAINPDDQVIKQSTPNFTPSYGREIGCFVWILIRGKGRCLADYFFGAGVTVCQVVYYYHSTSSRFLTEFNTAERIIFSRYYFGISNISCDLLYTGVFENGSIF